MVRLLHKRAAPRGWGKVLIVRDTLVGEDWKNRNSFAENLTEFSIG